MTSSVNFPLPAGTAADALRAHAERRADDLAYAFLPERETEPEEVLRYGALLRRAEQVGAGLDRHFAARPGVPRVALLLFPAGLDFVVGFWGCLFGRVVAVPAAMPRPGRHAATLEGVARNAGARLVLTSRHTAEAVVRSLRASPSLADLDVLSVDEVAAEGDGRGAPPRPRPEDVAFLQYTSGSTGRPKGVVVRHRNLSANQAMISDAMGLAEEPVRVANWLPHYHDMGLVGGLLQGASRGGCCVTMAPTTFLKRPVRWLETVTRWRCSLSGGPDFAFRLCVDRVRPEQMASLDLSSWRVAFDGAEPVRAATLSAFIARFGAVGFRPEALYPCYGMAEATLLAAGDRPGRAFIAEPASGEAAGRAAEAVCSGWAPAPARLAVVDPGTSRRCADREIGEIWLAGPHVADGYHDDPDATAAVFGAAIAGPEPDPGPWLRTGDLGYLSDGGVFVRGRLKEMMIVNGRNVYPHDVEDVLRGGIAGVHDAAVFALADGDGERTVAVLELAATHRSLILQPGPDAAGAQRAVARAARALAGQSCELPLDHVRLALPGGIAKTTSGKTRYGALRARVALLPDDVRRSPVSAETRRDREDRP